jgi:DNA-binding NarL/FixJ family response regulator
MSGTVILADEYPIVLDGLENLLHKSDFKILARCTTGEETLRALRRYRSDILVFDTHIPLKNGLEILTEMKESKLPTRSVVFTVRLNDDEILEALRLGISGLVPKELASSKTILLFTVASELPL